MIDVDSLYGCTYNCLGNYAWVIGYWREIDGLAGRCLSFLGTCKVNLVIETHLRLNEVGLILNPYFTWAIHYYQRNHENHYAYS